MDKVRFMISDGVFTEMLRRSPRGLGQALARKIVDRYTDQIQLALKDAQTYTAVVEALAAFAEMYVSVPGFGDRLSLVDYATSADAQRERHTAELSLWRALARHEQPGEG